ncbi:MAG: hypothetical protein IPO63_16480 [Bacteroidetes bacterium]|nr:hypothetical protein [Bacteroidota bacterium]
MNINQNNYEAWFLDYYEKQLSAEQVAELFLFLEQHPILKEEFDAFADISITAPLIEEEKFNNKQSLKKYDEVCKENIQDWLIAQLEGDLNTQQLLSLEKFILANPSYLKDQRILAKTKSENNEVENYDCKSSVKQFAAITSDNIQNWLIADLHSDLNLQERSTLLAFLKTHPQFTVDKALYQQTILSAVNEEEFPNKKKLRKGIVIPFYQQKHFYRIAAMLLLLLGGGILFTIYQNNIGSDRHVVEVKDSIMTPSLITPSRSLATPIYEKEKQIASIDTLSKTTNPSTQKKKSTKIILPKINPEQNNFAEEKSSPKINKTAPPLRHNKNIFVRQDEELMAMELKGMQPLPISQPSIRLERRYTPKATIAYENPNEPPSLLEILQATRLANEVIDVTAKKFNNAIGGDLVSSPENPIPLPFKSRLYKFVGKAISKISNNRVKVRTTFNPITGKMSAYEIQTNKKTIQRQFESAKY